MSRHAIITDLNRCVGCLSCSVSCKMSNNVPVGNFWNKTLRIGPTPRYEGAKVPDVDLYFLTVSCQHCEHPSCVEVCPTEASHVADDGTVQIDKSKCIGCQFCAMACPYGVRYLNEEERVVEKCTLCEQRITQGELPECVAGCVAMARFFGDLDAQNIRDFRGAMSKTLGQVVEDFSEKDIHHLPNVGNDPSFAYILRDMDWKGGE